MSTNIYNQIDAEQYQEQKRQEQIQVKRFMSREYGKAYAELDTEEERSLYRERFAEMIEKAETTMQNMVMGIPLIDGKYEISQDNEYLKSKEHRKLFLEINIFLAMYEDRPLTRDVFDLIETYKDVDTLDLKIGDIYPGLTDKPRKRIDGVLTKDIWLEALIITCIENNKPISGQTLYNIFRDDTIDIERIIDRRLC